MTTRRSHARNGRGVFVLGSTDFEAGVPLGDWQLARAMSRMGLDVVYVNPPRAPRVATLRRATGRPAPVGDAAGAPRVLRPVSLAGAALPQLNELKDRVVAAQLNAVARARWRTAPLVLAVHPRSGPAPHVRRQALVYWQKDRQWASHRDGETAASSSLRLRHEALLYTADVVTGVSAQIVEDNARLGVTAHLIPNGVEVAHWTRAAEEPPDLAVIPGPRVLFSGSWGWRVDQPTVVEMALMRPQYAFVVVGEGAPPATAPSNLHFLGKKSYSALPGYLQHSSVGVIPYLDNEFNAASSPLKMWEYVASGLPVIGSGVPFPSGLSGVRTVAGVSAWLQALDEEVLAAGQAGRRSPDLEILEEVSWEARAARLLELADDVVRCR